MCSVALDNAREKILYAKLRETMSTNLINIVIRYLNYSEAQKVWLALHTDKYCYTDAHTWRMFSTSRDRSGLVYIMSITMYAQNAEAARAENDTEWKEGDQNKFQICFDNLYHMHDTNGTIVDVSIDDLMPSKGFHPIVDPRFQHVVDECRSSFISSMTDSINKIGT